MSGIVCALLAAGGSTRFGSPKQLVSIDGVPLVRRVAERALASRCEAVAVVVGASEGEVRAALAHCDVTLLVNRDWLQGIGTSIRCAADWARAFGAQALVLSAIDQPALVAQSFDRLIEAAQASERVEFARVGSAYADTVGVPALFGSAHFSCLRELDGDVGAKRLLQMEPDQVTRVAFPEGAWDIDSPTDLTP